MPVPTIHHAGPWAPARLGAAGVEPFPARAGDVMDSTITGLGARSNRRVAETVALKQNGTRP